MRSSRGLFLLLTLFLAACSMRSAIDAMSSPEDRAFAQDFVQKVRSGDVKPLRPLFDAELWRESEPQLVQARALFPPAPGTTELIGYHFASNTTNGVTFQTADYSLVTHDGSHWTTTLIRTRSDQGGPKRVIGWNVNGSAEMPPAYRQFQTMEAAAPWIQGGLIFALLVVGVLVFWLVRRSRRKHRVA